MLRIDIFTIGREARFSVPSPLINFRAMKYAVFNTNADVLQKYTIVAIAFFSLFVFSQKLGAQVPGYSVENRFMTKGKPPIVPGAYQLDLYLPRLSGKNIAVVGNQTSMVIDPQEREHKHLVDYLLSQNVKVLKVFSPEHGFRGDGDAGELIQSDVDKKTGIPIFSLYGNNKKPKPEQLSEVDVVLFDLQDVGVRFYTYISTLHYVMEACAELKIPLIVLDRPNPNIDIIDGPMLEDKQKSFIGMHPVPLIYGMTIGEYAQMINGEQWIPVKTDLTVIPCLNYKRGMRYSLPVAPSPNLKTDQSVAWYASLCLFEGTVVSVGRGTEKPFEQIGHPDFPDKTHSFVPLPRVGSKEPLLNGKTCYGVNFSDSVPPRRLDLRPILNFYSKFPNKEQFFLKNNFFNLLAGNTILKEQIALGLTEEIIRQTWQPDLEKFIKLRIPYLIYAE